MKKLITILIFISLTVVGFGQLLAPKGIKIGTGASAQTALNLTSTASYTIEKVGSTYYARPGIGSGLTAYSNTDLATVFNQAITALPAKGGNIFIRSSVVDSVTTSIIDDGHSNVELIFEKGSKLIAKAGLNAPVIYLTSVSHWRIKGVEIDGNAANQEVPDIGNADSHGIKAYTGSDIVVSDAYIHDVRVFGVWFMGTISNSGVINSTVTLCGWNCVQPGGDALATHLFVINNDLSHCGDCGISCIGTGHKVINNTIHDIDGSTGYSNGNIAIAFEFAGGGHIIEGNTIYNVNTGIYAFDGWDNNTISGNSIFQWDIAQTYQSAMLISSDNNQINNNILKSTLAKGQGVKIYGGLSNQVVGNKITANNPILMDAVSSYNSIMANFLTGVGTVVAVANANCIANKVIENDIRSGSAPLNDLGTGTVIGNNIWKDGSYGGYKKAVTATADGLTTGILLTAWQNIIVTSASANNIVALPATDATTVGAVIKGIVGANGFELRVQAAQHATVYINGVTTDNVEAAIPASSTFEITCIDATHWILKAWTALGAVITAIVPDAV